MDRDTKLLIWMNATGATVAMACASAGAYMCWALFAWCLFPLYDFPRFRLAAAFGVVLALFILTTSESTAGDILSSSALWLAMIFSFGGAVARAIAQRRGWVGSAL